MEWRVGSRQPRSPGVDERGTGGASLWSSQRPLCCVQALQEHSASLFLSLLAEQPMAVHTVTSPLQLRLSMLNTPLIPLTVGLLITIVSLLAPGKPSRTCCSGLVVLQTWPGSPSAGVGGCQGKGQRCLQRPGVGGWPGSRELGAGRVEGGEQTAKKPSALPLTSHPGLSIGVSLCCVFLEGRWHAERDLKTNYLHVNRYPAVFAFTPGLLTSSMKP